MPTMPTTPTIATMPAVKAATGAGRRIAASALAVAALFSGAGSAQAECGPDALGTSRTLTLKREFGAWGTNQHGPLPLSKGEVVLTFDDGPNPDTTPRVLDVLAGQCVKATFFMIGGAVARHPDLARRVVREGHTVAMHSHTHPNLANLPPAEQLADLKKIQDVWQATFGAAAPAYRFPMLVETPTMMSALESGKVAVFSTDVGIGDWEANVTTDVLAKRLVDNLKSTGGGIVLMHDAYKPLADALPLLLKLLKENGYKVVRLQWEEGQRP